MFNIIEAFYHQSYFLNLSDILLTYDFHAKSYTYLIYIYLHELRMSKHLWNHCHYSVGWNTPISGQNFQKRLDWFCILSFLNKVKKSSDQFETYTKLRNTVSLFKESVLYHCRFQQALCYYSCMNVMAWNNVLYTSVDMGQLFHFLLNSTTSHESILHLGARNIKMNLSSSSHLVLGKTKTKAHQSEKRTHSGQRIIIWE